MGNYTSCIDYNRISKSENNLYSFSSWAGVAYGNNGVSVLSSVRQNLEYAGQDHDNCFSESIKFVADIETKTTEVTNELSNLSDCLLETVKAFEKAEDKIGNMVTKESALLALLSKLDAIYDRDKNNSLTKDINPGDNISFNSDNFKKNAKDEVRNEIENKIKEANAEASQAAKSTLNVDDESDKTGALAVGPFASLVATGLQTGISLAYLSTLKLPQGAMSKAGYKQALIDKIKEKYPNFDDKAAAKAADSYIKSQSKTTEKIPSESNASTDNTTATTESQPEGKSGGNTGTSQQYRQTSNTSGSNNSGNSSGAKPSGTQDKIVAKVKPGGELPDDGTADIGAELKPVVPKPEPKPDIPKPDNKPQPLPDNKPDTNTPQPLPDNKPDNGGTSTDSNQTPNTNTNNNTNNTTPNTSTNTNTGGGNTYRPTTNTGGNSNANSGAVTPPVQEPTTPTPSTPDSNTGSANGVGDSLDVISIDKETPKTTGTTTKSSGGSNVIPIGLGVAAAGAAAVAGARFIKNRSNKEESDENYEEEGNSFSYLGNYQDDDKYEENVSTGSNLYEETMDTPSPSKYKAGSVNKLVLDNGADVKIQSDDIINQKEELE